MGQIGAERPQERRSRPPAAERSLEELEDGRGRISAIRQIREVLLLERISRLETSIAVSRGALDLELVIREMERGGKVRLRNYP
jgi:hypothetical protein